MRIYDISLPLSGSLPVWPGDPRVSVSKVKSFEAGDDVNCSHLSCNVHSGTHVDAPSHSIPNGDSVESLPLAAMIGSAYVAWIPEADEIGPAELEQLQLPSTVRRLLLRTRNSHLWAKEEVEFTRDFVALTPAAAQWIVDRDIRLLAVDYLSVQRFAEAGQDTHLRLLKAGVVIVEGVNLHDILPGVYQLVCLPVKLVAAEGAPARVVLIEG